MKVAIAFVGLFIVASAGYAPIFLPATTLVRSPSDDSAIVHSQRLGGSFAYSTLEGHAYKGITPVVQNVISPYVSSVQWGSDLPVVATVPRFILQQPAILGSPAVTSIIVPGPGVPATVEPASPEKLKTDEPKPETEEKTEGDSDDTVAVESA